MFLLNPTDSSKLRPLGIELSNGVNLGQLTYLSTDLPNHPLLRYTAPESFGVTAYYPMKVDDSFDVLLTCNSDAVMVAKKNLTSEEAGGKKDNTKLFVFSSPISYSELAIKAEMVLFMVNAFDYYLPVTVEKSFYSVGETVTLNCRGNRVVIGDETYTTFPATTKFYLPGIYEIKTVFSAVGEQKENAATDTIYVCVNAEESDIFAVKDGLINPFEDESGLDEFIDLMYIFAAVLTALLFAEWILNLLQGM